MCKIDVHNSIYAHILSVEPHKYCCRVTLMSVKHFILRRGDNFIVEAAEQEWSCKKSEVLHFLLFVCSAILYNL